MYHFIKSSAPKFKSLMSYSTLAISLLIANIANGALVENFGQNTDGLRQAFINRHVHILQVGDSHTAGDYFTEQLRKRLQADVGDGGIGFAYPMTVSGQRTARHGYQSNDWQLSNSRTNRAADYPLGGMVASPISRSANLTLTSQTYAGDSQNAKIVIKGNAGQTISVRDNQGSRQLSLKQSGWQTVNTPISFPVTFNTDNNVNLGGFWLDRGTGGRVSALGINGATQDFWQRWHPSLAQELSQSNADLVILAYGTNEAFQENPTSQANAIQYAINNIRQGLPNASILLVNAPESLKDTSGRCGVRATSLDTSQTTIRRLAQQNKTLYWSWQDAMGGSCSMKKWIAQGLGRSDGVHFSKEGYEKAANNLYDNLSTVLKVSSSITSNDNGFRSVNAPNANSTTSRSNIYTEPMSQSKAVICDMKGKCTVFKN